MNYTLLLSSDNISFTELDLFPEQSLSYEAEFYDDKSVTDIKIPFYTDIKIPLTATNKQFFGYDPVYNNVLSYPKDDYYYKIQVHNSSNTELAGIARIKTIEYNSDSPYLFVELIDYLNLFLNNIRELGVGDILTDSSHTTQKTMSDFFAVTSQGGERGTINVQPDTTRIVNFPFVDFCNDVQRFNYEIRQFTEYGAGFDRAGFVPTLSVQQYLKQIGEYLSTTTGLSVKVKSKLFAINETEALPDFEAEKLQMIIPARLLCKKEFNTREFVLSQYDFWVGTNEALTSEKDLNGNDKLCLTNWLGDKETFGNYDATNDISYQKYGIKNQSDKISIYTGNSTLIQSEDNLGWFCPHMNFKGRVEYTYHPTLTRFRPTGTIKLDIPVIGEDKFIYNIDPTQSDAEFNLCIGIYEDGYLKKEIALRNSDGTPIVLQASNATAVEGESYKYLQSRKDFERKAYDPAYGNVQLGLYFNANIHPTSGRKDMLQWSTVDAYLPDLEQMLIDIYSESRYAVNYYLKPVSGSLRVSYANDFEVIGGTFGGLIWSVKTATSETIEVSNIRKSVSHIQAYSYFAMQIKANEDFNPYFPGDRYVIKDSLNNSNDLTPIDLLKAVAKRFSCGLFYGFDGTDHIIRIDPLHIARTQGGELEIDDLKSIKISQPSDKIKNLVIKNKSYDSFYDSVGDDIVRGDITREINPSGLSDLEIELDSGVYYKSITGDLFFEEENQNLELGIINKFEYGVTDNVFGTKNQIGIRFAYLNPPAYKTQIKVPFSIDKSLRPNLTTETERIYRSMYSYPSYTEESKHIFNGRLTHINSQGFNLLAGDDSSLPTDYYDLISSSEQVKSKGSVSIELSAVFSTNDVSDVSFMLEKKRLGLANGQNVLIKSVSGEVYEKYTYLDIKGLIE